MLLLPYNLPCTAVVQLISEIKITGTVVVVADWWLKVLFICRHCLCVYVLHLMRLMRLMCLMCLFAWCQCLLLKLWSFLSHCVWMLLSISFSISISISFCFFCSNLWTLRWLHSAAAASWSTTTTTTLARERQAHFSLFPLTFLDASKEEKRKKESERRKRDKHWKCYRTKTHTQFTVQYNTHTHLYS